MVEEDVARRLPISTLGPEYCIREVRIASVMTTVGDGDFVAECVLTVSNLGEITNAEIECFVLEALEGGPKVVKKQFSSEMDESSEGLRVSFHIRLSNFHNCMRRLVVLFVHSLFPTFP